MGAHIEEEIVMDILSRLPGKSLLRFKCVSESWNTLISESYFKRKHLNHAMNDQNSQKMLIGVRCYDEHDTFYIYSSSLSSDNPLIKNILRLDYWPDSNFKPWHGRVFCCCDGLCLIGIWSKPQEEPSILMLWNPCSRESILLPHPSIYGLENNSNSTGENYTMYGLGYDSTSDNYKVVRIVDDGLFVLKSGLWRKIDHELSGRKRYDWLLESNVESLAFVHGAFHWYGCSSRYLVNSTRYCVISFNISDEMFGEISFSDEFFREIQLSKVGVSVLGGMLCVHAKYKTIFNAWVMKDYGVTESWMRLFTIPINGISSFIEPMYRFPDDKVLLSAMTRCGTVYSMHDRSFGLTKQCALDSEDIDASDIHDTIVYTESLTSPKLD